MENTSNAGPTPDSPQSTTNHLAVAFAMVEDSDGALDMDSDTGADLAPSEALAPA